RMGRWFNANFSGIPPSRKRAALLQPPMDSNFPPSPSFSTRQYLPAVSTPVNELQQPTPPAEPPAIAPGNQPRTSPGNGLLWAEWFAHRRLLVIFLAVWLVGVWVPPLFTHPGWILVLGPLYAFVAGPVYGG